MSNNKGFSLIEIMVALGTLGILTSLAVPNYLAWNAKHNLKSNASALSGNIQISKWSAISQNKNVSLTLSATGDTTSYSTPGDTVVPSEIFSGDVSVSETLPITVTFNAFGQCNSCGGANQIITLNSAKNPGIQYAVTISPNGRGDLTKILSSEEGGGSESAESEGCGFTC